MSTGNLLFPFVRRLRALEPPGLNVNRVNTSGPSERLGCANFCKALPKERPRSVGNPLEQIAEAALRVLDHADQLISSPEIPALLQSLTHATGKLDQLISRSGGKIGHRCHAGCRRGFGYSLVVGRCRDASTTR